MKRRTHHPILRRLRARLRVRLAAIERREQAAAALGDHRDAADQQMRRLGLSEAFEQLDYLDHELRENRR